MSVDEWSLFVATFLYYVVILIEDIAFALWLQLFSLLLYNGNVTVVVTLVCNSLFQLLYFLWKLLLYILNTVNTQQSFDLVRINKPYVVVLNRLIDHVSRNNLHTNSNLPINRITVLKLHWCESRMIFWWPWTTRGVSCCSYLIWQRRLTL